MVTSVRRKGLAIVLAAMTAMASLGMTSTIAHAETASGALTISTQEQMDTWVSNANYYKDASSVVTLNADVTVSSPVSEFAGTFNGGDHTVTLALNTAADKTAFIGTLAATGEVNGVKFTGSVKSSTTGDYVAAAVALNQGVINDVTNTATVEAKSAYNVGGITGYNDNYTAGSVGVVENSRNNAAVTGKSKTGGIVGENAGIVSSCSNTAAITSTGGGKDGTGGITGRNGNNNTAVETGVIKNCYNKGNIADSNGRWVGGIAGFQNSLSSTKNSYSIGTLSAYRDSGNIVGKDEGTTENCTSTAASDLTTSENPGIWEAGTTPAELTYSAKETNDPGKEASTATDFYLGGTNASDTNSGLAGKSVATLAKAVELADASSASAKTIHVIGAVTIADTEKVFAGSGVTAKWEGSGDTMFDVTGSLTLGGLRVEGNGVSTMFAVEDGGALKIRNNAALSGAATAIDVKAGGDLLLNRSSVSGTAYAVKLAGATSTCTMSVASGQTIAIGGNVYLGTGATIEMAANPSTMLSSAITVECQATDAEILVAIPASGVIFTDLDLTKIMPLNASYDVGIDSENIIFAK